MQHARRPGARLKLCDYNQHNPWPLRGFGTSSSSVLPIAQWQQLARSVRAAAPVFLATMSIVAMEPVGKHTSHAAGQAIATPGQMHRGGPSWRSFAFSMQVAGSRGAGEQV